MEKKNINQPKMERKQFDDYEIHPCNYYGDFVELVTDESEAEFWSLYGHIPNQGIERIGDFETRQHAEEIYQRITGKKGS